jgi:hypothetical protein
MGERNRGKRSSFSASVTIALLALSATAIASEPLNNNFPRGANGIANGDMQVLGGYGSNQLTGGISSSTDTDYIFLGCSSHSIISSVVLSGLTADLDLYIYDVNGSSITSSRLGGTSTEWITGLDSGPSAYTSALVAQIVGYNFATSNYTLTVNCSSI